VFIDQVGYSYELAGENLARDYDSESAIIEAWYDSPPHRENLLNRDFEDMGLAIVSGINPNGRQSTVIVHLLAKPVSNNVDLNRFVSPKVLTHQPFQRVIDWLIITLACVTSVLIHYQIRRYQKSNHLDSSLWHH
jgi:hypothetical protein